jgi:hypothetical protein
MPKSNVEKRTGGFTALGVRLGAVTLALVGLTPAAPARAAADRPPVPERIERIRTALAERGPVSLGTLATVVARGAQDTKPPDWNDWNDWADV